MKKNENEDIIQISSAPFSQPHLNQIFQYSPKHQDRLISRESAWLEFKESFNWSGREEYARTVAAFANNKGGYLVFGVKNSPHIIVGIDVKKFESVDPADISKYFHNVFDVEIGWEAKLIPAGDKTLLLFYVFPAARKPIISAITGHKQNIAEGDIYYRYRGRTQRIRYPELQQLLEEQRRFEQASWLRLLRQIAHVGIQNTAVIDLTSGKGIAPGSSFLIDEKMLKQVKFLKEGEFVDKAGAPAVQLIGNVTSLPSGVIRPTNKVEIARTINTPDIINAFLKTTRVANPLEFVDRICFENSAFLPTYYFIHLANISRVEAVSRLERLQSTNSSRKGLIKRLSGDDELYVPPPKATSSESGRLRTEFIDKLKRKKVKSAIPDEYVKYAVKAIRSLAPDEIQHDYCCKLLAAWFNMYYGGADSQLSDEIRRSICYLDRAKYRVA